MVPGEGTESDLREMAKVNTRQGRRRWCREGRPHAVQPSQGARGCGEGGLASRGRERHHQLRRGPEPAAARGPPPPARLRRHPGRGKRKCARMETAPGEGLGFPRAEAFPGLGSSGIQPRGARPPSPTTHPRRRRRGPAPRPQRPPASQPRLRAQRAPRPASGADPGRASGPPRPSFPQPPAPRTASPPAGRAGGGRHESGGRHLRLVATLGGGGVEPPLGSARCSPPGAPTRPGPRRARVSGFPQQGRGGRQVPRAGGRRRAGGVPPPEPPPPPPAPGGCGHGPARPRARRRHSAAGRGRGRGRARGGRPVCPGSSVCTEGGARPTLLNIARRHGIASHTGIFKRTGGGYMVNKEDASPRLQVCLERSTQGLAHPGGLIRLHSTPQPPTE